MLRFASLYWSSHVVFKWMNFVRRPRAFGKTNQAPLQCFNVKCFIFFWYKFRSLSVERHINTSYHKVSPGVCFPKTTSVGESYF